MSGWEEWAVALGVVVAVLVVLLRIARVEQIRQAELKALCARTLDDLDQRPEFDVQPADWPIRESPAPRVGAQR